MLNCLPVESVTRNVIRCKECRATLFTQNDMTGFMAYDPEDFGKLAGYADRKKFEEDANFLLLTEDFGMYSTLKIDHKKSLKLEYHPFFMMFMLMIECQKCASQLGYQVETVNQNTEWMEGRLIIDASKIALFKDGKDILPKIISSLRLKLVKLLQKQKQSKKQEQVNLQKKIIQKCERMKIKSNKNEKRPKSKKDHLKKAKVSQDHKKRTVSVQSTRGQTSYISKKDESYISNSMAHDMIFKTQETSYGLCLYEEKAYQRGNFSSSIVQVPMESFQKSRPIEEKRQKDDDKNEYKHIELSQETRELLNQNLKKWSKKTLEESHGLKSHQLLAGIIQKMWRIDEIEKMVYHKIVNQQIEMMKCNAKVKKELLENLMEDVSTSKRIS